MVTVPNVVAKTPHLERNPIFVNVEDRFSKPTPFDPVIVVDVGDGGGEEGGHVPLPQHRRCTSGCPTTRASLDQVPEGDAARRAWVAEQLKARLAKDGGSLPRQAHRALRRGEGLPKVEFAEAFEISEYGSVPSKDELKTLFPFF